MQHDLCDRLIQSTNADLDSPAEWEHAQRFFFESLVTVRALLPQAAQEQLSARGPELPPASVLEAARAALWHSIAGDSLGDTPQGAAVRATLFAFFPPESDGPLDAIASFCTLYTRAGLPEESLVRAFRKQWPQNDA